MADMEGWGMTVIEIASHNGVPLHLNTEMIVASSREDALAAFRRRHPGFETDVYTCGNRYWFAMEWKR